MRQRKAPRAGFIPYYIENGEIYFMLMKPSDPMYGGTEFQLAKGKVEEGESSVEAAYREANEELGLLSDNIISGVHLGCFLGYTEVYYGEVIDRDNFIETTYETSETAWMTIGEFLQYGRKLHKPIFKKFIDEVNLTVLAQQNH
jgi:8-oxo-dGTP pyrophosphatase MutT (NUDIX family)|tara:strand:- start:200 stop:631 length:432 start_codon:yes stop_codon:yes gene_type:complete